MPNIAKAKKPKPKKPKITTQFMLNVWMEEVLGQLGKIANGVTRKNEELYLAGILEKLNQLEMYLDHLNELRGIREKLDEIIRITHTFRLGLIGQDENVRKLIEQLQKMSNKGEQQN